MSNLKLGPKPRKLNKVTAPWLDLSRYEAAANFKFSDWYIQIAIRRHLLLFEDNREIFLRVWSSIQTNPIYDLENDLDFLIRVKGAALYWLMPKKLQQPLLLQVSDLTFDDFLDVLEAVNQRRLRQAQSERLADDDDIPGMPAKFPNWPPLWLYQPVTYSYSQSYPGLGLIKFNPELSNSVLKQQFERYLEIHRPEGERIRFDRPRIDLWSKYGLLPLLDILIWEKLTNVKYSDTALVDAIMPPEVHNNEKGDPLSSFRKTLKPQLIELLKKDSQGMRNLLRAAGTQT